MHDDDPEEHPNARGQSSDHGAGAPQKPRPKPPRFEVAGSMVMAEEGLQNYLI